MNQKNYDVYKIKNEWYTKLVNFIIYLLKIVYMEKKTIPVIQSITQKEKDWKKLFIETAGIEDLTEESSWVDILKRGDFDLPSFKTFVAKAGEELGYYRDEEANFLLILPWVYRVSNKVLPYVDADMPDGNQFQVGEDKNFPNVCIIYHKKRMKLFECYIIDPKIAEIMTTDVFLWVPKLWISALSEADGVVCFSFVKEIPAHFNIK